MNKKEIIKVLHIFETYSHVYQPYIPPVIENLKRSKNLDVSVVAFKGKSIKGLSIVPKYYKRRVFERWNQFINKSFKNLSYIEIKALKRKTNIIHVQQAFMFPRILGLTQIHKNKRPKLVVTLRGSETYVNPWINNKWKSFFKDHGNKIDAFVVMSMDHKTYLERWGVDTKRIHIIPISFGQSFKTQTKIVSKDVIKIVSVFRLCWEKNINGNLLVVKNLKEQGYIVSYHIYGDGVELGKLYYLINKYELNDIVKVHGRVDNNELKNKLKNYDFILQLSHLESLGMSVIEAASFGLPAVVAATGGLPEVVKDGETGFVVDSNDHVGAANKILVLWNNQDLYHKFSVSAIDHIHLKFSIEVETLKLKELYKSLIKV